MYESYQAVSEADELYQSILLSGSHTNMEILVILLAESRRLASWRFSVSVNMTAVKTQPNSMILPFAETSGRSVHK